ncbi:MAG: 3'-5' exonuclease [Dehalococcoidia bacterium]|nr:3'-5' exonuclease [Dehalococcoidia bacterium]
MDVNSPEARFLAAGARRLEDDGTLQEPGGEPAGAGKHRRPALAIDLEMSGPNAMVHEVLDVGAVLTAPRDGFPELESWGSRVRPKRIGNAQPAALKVVGYSARAWKSAMEIEGAFAKLAELGKDAAITGWGIGQDMSFLVQTYRTLEMAWPFAPVAVDVQPVARKLLKGTGSVDRFNLGHVADRLGIGRDGEHGALPDALATYDVLVALARQAPASEG